MAAHYIEAPVLEGKDLGGGFSWLSLGGCAALTSSRPGQFVMLRGDWARDPVLPRAYSILWSEGERAEFLIRRVGRGSERLAAVRPGERLALLGPLGNSFPAPDSGSRDLLVAGGCGLAPLYFAARRAATERWAQAALPELLVGARSQQELALLDTLPSTLKVSLSTEDGSAGSKGLVTDLLRQRLEAAAAAGAPGATLRIMSCGPEAMLRAVRQLAREHQVRCYLSLEAPMACGIGACLGCAVEGRYQPYLYVCQQGPVFDAEEVWP